MISMPKARRMGTSKKQLRHFSRSHARQSVVFLWSAVWRRQLHAPKYLTRITDRFARRGCRQRFALCRAAARRLNLVCLSDAIPAVLVPVETFLTSGTTIPNSITANLTIGGVSSGDVNYSRAV